MSKDSSIPPRSQTTSVTSHPQQKQNWINYLLLPQSVALWILRCIHQCHLSLYKLHFTCPLLCTHHFTMLISLHKCNKVQWWVYRMLKALDFRENFRKAHQAPLCRGLKVWDIVKKIWNLFTLWYRWKTRHSMLGSYLPEKLRHLKLLEVSGCPSPML